MKKVIRFIECSGVNAVNSQLEKSGVEYVDSYPLDDVIILIIKIEIYG